MNSGKVFRKTCTVHYFRALVLIPEHYFDQLIWSSTKFLMFDKINVWDFDQEDAGTFGIYKLFWIFFNSCEFDDLPFFLVSEEGVSKSVHEN